MANRRLTIDEQKRATMRSAKTIAEGGFTAGGKKRATKPITLATTPWKDTDQQETKPTPDEDSLK